MPVYPYSVKNFNVYGPGGVEVAVSDITLPHVQWVKDTVRGASWAGESNLGIEGNPQAMEAQITFHTTNPYALALFSGGGQRIRCLSSIYGADTASGLVSEDPEEIIMTCWTQGFNLGKRETSAKGGIVLGFDITYLALLWGGRKWWEIDQGGNVCIINGVDLNSITRANT
jgi:P2 family phage contractile tail tube protein